MTIESTVNKIVSEQHYYNLDLSYDGNNDNKIQFGNRYFYCQKYLANNCSSSVKLRYNFIDSSVVNE